MAAQAIKRVPCLAKETLAGGFLFGVGVDSGGPAVTIQCRRLSCYQCLASASFSVSPFGGMAAKIVEHITSSLQAEAQDLLEETMAEYQQVQEESQELLGEQQQQHQAEEKEGQEDALEGLTPVATNGGWSITRLCHHHGFCFLFFFLFFVF